MISYLGETSNSFAVKLGYSRAQTIYDIQKMKSAPSYDFFQRFSIAGFSAIINIDWLLTGEGSMLRDNKNNDESKRSSTAITTPILPTEESIIYKMYKEKDEENKILIEKIGGLKERIRQLESQNKESEHPSIVGNITEAFTKESSGDYGEDSRSTKLLSGSKRSSVGKV